MFTEETIWTIRNRKNDRVVETPLIADWEIDMCGMSEPIVPAVKSARETFDLWRVNVKKKYADGLVPITWFVKTKTNTEYMPFQFSSRTLPPHFLEYFSWPVHKETGQPLNWLMLPIGNKIWSSERPDKCGFIQEALSWKPSILQPFVYLASLVQR